MNRKEEIFQYTFSHIMNTYTHARMRKQAHSTIKGVISIEAVNSTTITIVLLLQLHASRSLTAAQLLLLLLLLL